VLVFGNRDISFLEHRADHAVIRAGAGVPWHGLVMWSLQEGLSGLENLALIPGTAGAAPIQNIGAYGAQVGEFIQAVEAWDCQEQSWVRLDNEQCRFTYRDSVFKQQMDRYLITAIELKLPLLHDLRMDYAGIREELQAQGVELPSAVDVANAVIAIRRRKLPDPDVLGNAGSFFKNPAHDSYPVEPSHAR
ncbi:FAD-binding protein, partial [Stenotrophomonas maltophilia]|uniref:FAD-binding protein n=1 Tax=Stenotrophomonas maltophilia TaxID=40324 RepID=UPI00066C120F